MNLKFLGLAIISILVLSSFAFALFPPAQPSENVDALSDPNRFIDPADTRDLESGRYVDKLGYSPALKTINGVPSFKHNIDIVSKDTFLEIINDYYNSEISLDINISKLRTDLNFSDTNDPQYVLTDGTRSITDDFNILGVLTVYADLALTGNLILPATTSTTGSIKVGADRYIHFYNGGVFIGKNAGNYTLTGTTPLGLGEGALASLTDGSYNLAIGHNALNANTEGIGNTAIGANALAANETGDYSLALGYNSLALSTGTGRNVALGNQALAACTTASHNVAVGASSLIRTAGGADNVALGSKSGANNVSGVQNVFIGKNAGQGLVTPTNISNSVMIGFGAGGQVANNTSNKLYIANSNTITPLIYGEFDTPLLGFYASTISQADSNKQIQWELADDNHFHLTKEDDNVLGFKVDMPLRAGDDNNYLSTTADGAIELHGTARVTRHMWLHPESFRLHDVTPPSKSRIGVFAVFNFDKARDESIYATQMIPYNWDSNTDMELSIDWLHDTEIDLGAVVWACEYLSVKEGETVDGITTTITQTSDGNHAAGELIKTTFSTNVLAANLEGGDDLAVRIYREGGSLGDTLNEDAHLVLIHFHYTLNRLGLPVNHAS